MQRFRGIFRGRSIAIVALATWEIVCGLAFCAAILMAGHYTDLTGIELAIGDLLILSGFMGFAAATLMYSGVIITAITIYVLLPILGIVSIFVAYGFWKHKNWSWVGGVLLAAIGVVLATASLATPPWDITTAPSLVDGLLIGPWSFVGLFINIIILVYLAPRRLTFEMVMCPESGCSKRATKKYKSIGGQIIYLCDEHYKEWTKY